MFWKKKKKGIKVEAEGVTEELNKYSNAVATGFLKVLNKNSTKHKWSKEEVNEIIMLAFSKTVVTLKKQGLLEHLNVEVEKDNSKDSYFG